MNRENNDNNSDIDSNHPDYYKIKSFKENKISHRVYSLFQNFVMVANILGECVREILAVDYLVNEEKKHTDVDMNINDDKKDIDIKRPHAESQLADTDVAV